MSSVPPLSGCSSVPEPRPFQPRGVILGMLLLCSDSMAVLSRPAIATVLGAASAAVSAYWALGGTALLDTVGGEIERWGRERSADVVATLWVITVAKLVGAVAPLVLVGVEARAGFPACAREPGRCERSDGFRGDRAHRLRGCAHCRRAAGRGWVFDAADDADEHAIAWHASSGTHGSRCGVSPSRWPCGAAARKRPYDALRVPRIRWQHPLTLLGSHRSPGPPRRRSIVVRRLVRTRIQ